MKRFALYSLLCVSIVAGSSLPALAQAQSSAVQKQDEHSQAKHSFGVAEFDRFHDILHPLQHEALPNNDFKLIRESAAELFAAGNALAEHGTPTGVKNATDYKAGLKKFRAALKQYEQDAKSGSDEQLRTSYTAVHDTFEELVDLLPRKVQH
ncbi:MAG: hypothetical protein M3371_03765 [Acidobacteriota bacterium]|nr:hypothetical protein [Acidobacteriota bacterium]